MDLIDKAKSKRWIPDYEHPSYHSLTNCKFEALYRASILWPHDNLAWIDGGLRDPKQDFAIRWAPDNRIRATAIGTIWGRSEFVVTSFLCGDSIMGGCFGGSSSAVQWLFEQTYQLQTKLLESGTYTTDQGLMTIVAYHNPSRFFLKPQYKVYFGIYTDPYWQNVTHCLDDAARGNLYYHYTICLPILFVLVSYVLYLYLK